MAPGMTPHPFRQESLSQLLTRPPNLKNKNGGRPQILVLKVGTSTLLDGDTQAFSLSNLGKFVDAVCNLKAKGYYVVMISSGAVGTGCLTMKLESRPTNLVEKQAISAIGQCRLVRLWEDIFALREQKVAQLLLTRRDLMDRPRFVNFRNTLVQLLAMGVIPIINENDALATEGLKFGDNDTLGAYVSISIGATWFFMLTDVDCLYTANPRLHPNAKPIAFVGKVDSVYKLLDRDENDGTRWGSGGMRTKIIAAKLCCATGIHTALNHGAYPERIIDVITFAEGGTERGSSSEEDDSQRYPVNPLDRNVVDKLTRAATLSLRPKNVAGGPAAESTSRQGEEEPKPDKEPDQDVSPAASTRAESDQTKSSTQCIPSPKACERKLGFITFPSLNEMPYLGTIFAGQPCTQHLRDQRRWILSLPIRGRVYCDENCVRAVIEKRKSLFAAGIVAVQDEFFPGEAVAMYPMSALNSNSAEAADNELARFIANFSSQELNRIKGKRACEFQNILGYFCAHEVAHRSNIIFVNPSPVYERYNVAWNASKVETDTESEEEYGLGTFSPVPVPLTGETHDHEVTSI